MDSGGGSSATSEALFSDVATDQYFTITKIAVSAVIIGDLEVGVAKTQPQPHTCAYHIQRQCRLPKQPEVHTRVEHGSWRTVRAGRLVVVRVEMEQLVEGRHMVHFGGA